MYELPVYRVQLVREASLFVEQRAVSSPSSAAEVVRKHLAGADREHLVVLLLDTKLKSIGISTVAVGTLNSCIIHPREVFKPAVLHNAHGIIVAHNHPSGDPRPSLEDAEIAKRLVESGDILGIFVQDVLIVGETGYYSFAAEGRLHQGSTRRAA
ncbi:MAG: JAB domain-containing protein [Bacillota bacterium]